MGTLLLLEMQEKAIAIRRHGDQFTPTGGSNRKPRSHTGSQSPGRSVLARACDNRLHQGAHPNDEQNAHANDRDF